MTLTPDQLERYARHIMLKEVGGPGQARLKNAEIALIGAGGLGGPAALYLAAAGVGRIRLIDDDEVSLSNLQRQILFDTSQIGTAKVDAGATQLAKLNPDIEIIPVSERLTTDNAADLLDGATLVLDGSDTFSTRFDVNQACFDLGSILVSGAIGRWAGQVSVFKAGLSKSRPEDERAPCYRCFVSEAPEHAETCEEVGVIGPLAGFVAARMALETVKEITGAGTSLSGRVWIFDGLTGDARTIALKRDPDCATCGRNTKN
ncbi:MAG: molybdopterin-synthase adenylyltransferase MoeB [Pseudomonadota bacterium]